MPNKYKLQTNTIEDWKDTKAIAETCMKSKGTSLDACVTQQLAKDLLRCILLIASKNDLVDWTLVRKLIADEKHSSGSIRKLLDHDRYPEALAVLKRVERAHGSWFCEPVLFLDLNLDEKHQPAIADSFDIEPSNQISI